LYKDLTWKEVGLARREEIIYPETCFGWIPPGWVFAIATFGIPFLPIGYMNMGQWKKGLAYLAMFFGTGIVTMGGGAVLTWIFSVVDVWVLATRLRYGHPIGQWEFFWTPRRPKD